MKILEREKAIDLRKKGLTYDEIKKYLNISRGALSHWLRNVPYESTDEVRERRRSASVQSGEVLHKRKLERVSRIMQIAKREAFIYEFILM